MVDRDDTTHSLARPLWPLLLAAFVSGLPMTATSLFVAPIAADLQTTAAMVGGLRGVGGVAALLVGLAVAPLIDRVPRALTLSLGLLMIAMADLLVSIGHLAGLVAFYVLFGSTTAILAPTIQAASADRLQGPEAGRAASEVSSAQTLSGVLAGPILGVAALVAGWQGAYVAMGISASCLGLLCALMLDRRRPSNVARAGYREAFTIVAQAPGAVPLLAASMLRSCVQFAWLTFLAAFLVEQFEASTGLVAWVWFLGAGVYCLTNLTVGRIANPTEGDCAVGWRSPTRLLVTSSVALVATAPLVFVSPTVSLALAATVAFCIALGASQATLLSVLVRRYAEIRGSVMGLNAAGVNVGMIAGASIAGASLGVGGYPGLAVTLVGMTVVAAMVMNLALRSAGVGAVHQAPMPV
jgi:predicted MFS family arabinose efflux permease